MARNAKVIHFGALWGSVAVFVAQMALTVLILAQSFYLYRHDWPESMRHAQIRYANVPHFYAPVLMMQPPECEGSPGPGLPPRVSMFTCPVVMSNCETLVSAAQCSGTYSTACHAVVALDCDATWRGLCSANSFPATPIGDEPIHKLCGHLCSGSRACEASHYEDTPLLQQYLSFQLYSRWLFDLPIRAEELSAQRFWAMIVVAFSYLLSNCSFFAIRMIVCLFVKIRSQNQGGVVVEDGYIPALDDERNVVIRKWTRWWGMIHAGEHVIFNWFLQLSLCSVFFVRWDGEFVTPFVPHAAIFCFLLLFFSVVLALLNNLKGPGWVVALLAIYFPVTFGSVHLYALLTASLRTSAWLGDATGTTWSLSCCALLTVILLAGDLACLAAQAYSRHLKTLEAAQQPIGEVICTTGAAGRRRSKGPKAPESQPRGRKKSRENTQDFFDAELESRSGPSGYAENTHLLKRQRSLSPPIGGDPYATRNSAATTKVSRQANGRQRSHVGDIFFVGAGGARVPDAHDDVPLGSPRERAGFLPMYQTVSREDDQRLCVVPGCSQQ
mmetsp:Transcript_19573/g.42087  ORF Transcript_19573/g.42087 Transcript_19573/m.42087 type:complete len:555 (+) Transcript_19573:82-1746(+)